MIVPQGLYKDPRTAALDLAEKLKVGRWSFAGNLSNDRCGILFELADKILLTMMTRSTYNSFNAISLDFPDNCSSPVPTHIRSAPSPRYRSSREMER